MDLELNAAEVRVLGALIEKELTTPEYYPLTLNALTNACNQKSNREPVVSFDEKTVVRALEGLRQKNLATRSTGGGSRVPKYKHSLTSKFQLDQKEVAALCILMLRGPQTVGEIRGRTGRMYEFSDLEEVDDTLASLSQRDDGPFVMQLPRLPGHKESRYAHLFAGEPEIKPEEVPPNLEAATREVLGENERIAKIEEELERLREEFADLKNQFLEFRRQFE